MANITLVDDDENIVASVSLALESHGHKVTAYHDGASGLAALGFISVGVQPPAPELGLMMTEALPHWHEAPWLIAAPVAVLMLTVLGMMLLVGDEETGA